LNTGKEQNVTPAKKQRNIARNRAAKDAQTQRIAAKHAAGKARNAAGQFKKGKKN
jgi:hypothetical protein